MDKHNKEFTTEYNIGDIVYFEKDGVIDLGTIVCCYTNDTTIWYGIRITSNYGYIFSSNGDIYDYEIFGDINNKLKEMCIAKMKEL